MNLQESVGRDVPANPMSAALRAPLGWLLVWTRWGLEFRLRTKIPKVPCWEKYANAVTKWPSWRNPWLAVTLESMGRIAYRSVFFQKLWSRLLLYPEVSGPFSPQWFCLSRDIFFSFRTPIRFYMCIWTFMIFFTNVTNGKQFKHKCTKIYSWMTHFVCIQENVHWSQLVFHACPLKSAWNNLNWHYISHPLHEAKERNWQNIFLSICLCMCVWVWVSVCMCIYVCECVCASEDGECYMPRCAENE